uniref:Uncharacterized protein n=1 Tax=Solanum tuberosum TaxID=4113 RepID=M1DLG9_SOLTU
MLLSVSQDEGSLGEQQWFLSAGHVQGVDSDRDSKVQERDLLKDDKFTDMNDIFEVTIKVEWELKEEIIPKYKELKQELNTKVVAVDAQQSNYEFCDTEKALRSQTDDLKREEIQCNQTFLEDTTFEKEYKGEHVAFGVGWVPWLLFSVLFLRIVSRPNPPGRADTYSNT